MMPNARVGGFLGGMSLEALCDPQLQPGETGPLPQPGHLARKGSGKMERAEATSVGLGSQLDVAPCRRAPGTPLRIS